MLYHDLLKLVEAIGPFGEEVKKSSVHLTRGTAFAGVHFRKNYIQLTVTSDSTTDSPRILKCEQTSANRWRWDLKLLVNGDLDDELTGWLRAAYELAGTSIHA